MMIFLVLACKDNIDHSDGKKLFTSYCAGCHNFKNKGMGPPLGGLKGIVSKEWMMSFVTNPKAVIDQGDERALGLFNAFHTYMPAYEFLHKDSLEKIVDYILSIEAPEVVNIPEGSLEDPIPERIPQSDLLIELSPIAKFPVTNEKAPFTRIVKMANIPNSDLLFVADLQGQLYRLTEEGPSLYFKMQDYFPNFINKPGLATGLGSFAFHPDYLKNGLLYTSHSESAKSAKADFYLPDSIPIKLQWVVTEWKVNHNDTLFKATNREILRIDFVGQIHGMQDIAFNPLSKPGEKDFGLLYIGIGDGGAVERGFPFIATDENKLWGCLLRIDPKGRNSKNGKYGIPSDNPFLGKTQANEVFARGFRNPHRIHWLQDGRLLITNIGHFNIESLYVVKAGDHCGWPYREGRFLIDPLVDLSYVYENQKSTEKITFNYPVAQFDHDEGNAIIGGYEYLGEKVDSLKGKYLFGDIVSGRLFYINIPEIERGKDTQIYEWKVSRNGVSQSLLELTKGSRTDLRFGRDNDGEMYIMTKQDGMVYGLSSQAK